MGIDDHMAETRTDRSGNFHIEGKFHEIFFEVKNVFFHFFIRFQITQNPNETKTQLKFNSNEQKN